jgi:hypothetical protein
MSSEDFLFRSTDTVGAIEAENDKQFLEECFLDTGFLEILEDSDDYRSILIGRTGAGKSALLSRLTNNCENAISINPHELALTHIANSSAVKFFADLGVNLTPFFKFLWRHVFAIELIRLHARLDGQGQPQDLSSLIYNILPKDKKHDKAINYLKEHGGSFWKETEERVKEITRKLDERASESIGINLADKAKVDGSQALQLSEEEKREVIYKGQEVINGAQVKDLSTIIKLLSDIFSRNKQKRYHIIIDRLDEDWVDTPLRVKLIRALIENSRDFQAVPNVKIVMALRSDLVDRVYRLTRDEGFQEEKYRACNLALTWSRESMIKMLDRRIGALVRRRYTTKEVGYADILDPNSNCQRLTGTTMSSIDYMIERTLNRPRDLISFFNDCIRLSDGRPVIDFEVIQRAESTYSKERLRALFDEWRGTYPSLEDISGLLRKKPSIVAIKSLGDNDVQNILAKVYQSPESGISPLDRQIAQALYETQITEEEARSRICYILYLTGLAGLRVSLHDEAIWAHQSPDLITEADVHDYDYLEVQPTFRKALLVQEYEAT